jgi:hypothetical protein
MKNFFISELAEKFRRARDKIAAYYKGTHAAYVFSPMAEWQ